MQLCGSMTSKISSLGSTTWPTTALLTAPARRPAPPAPRRPGRHRPRRSRPFQAERLGFCTSISFSAPVGQVGAPRQGRGRPCRSARVAAWTARWHRMPRRPGHLGPAGRRQTVQPGAAAGCRRWAALCRHRRDRAPRGQDSRWPGWRTAQTFLAGASWLDSGALRRRHHSTPISRPPSTGSQPRERVLTKG